MKATETSILNFIGGFDKVFIIPPFQRNYEWSYEQCRELFEDIIKAHTTNKKHYLGNIVYYVGENNGASYSELILIDGQQRVSTILILLCALRDKTIDKNIINSINKRYLINDTDNSKFRVRLKQTSYDQRTFISIVDGRTEEIDKNNNIFKNYKYFLKLIDSENIEISDIYETISKLEIVDVNLQIENDLEVVQTIFEKINSTGKRLAPSDLIRNFLLLSTTSKEQEKLYEKYWIPIEKKVRGENISKFSKNFLTLNIFEEVSESKIYKKFKEYFSDLEMTHEEILYQMKHYSKYYEWIKFENCPNKKVNKVLKSLNFIKSDDFYPLYLFIFEELYDENVEELIKCLILLRDFLIRYRVVAPSGGGGTISAVVYNLIKKLKELDRTDEYYEIILFELSNSSTPAGRFPNDAEFKEALMNFVGNNYARIILLIIEESEKKNISVPLSEVTVEHLMPQILSEYWKTYLGGKEKAEFIHEKYLNCIGNKAPISKEYNSTISNRPWEEKKIYLKDVQFVITSEVCENEKWNEENIQKRNNEISTKACKYITSPLERTRSYQIKNPSNEFVEEGIYSISDTTTPMEGKDIDYIIFRDNHISVSTWKEFFSKICKIAYDVDKEKFQYIVEKNQIHKNRATKNYPEKDPLITENSNLLVTAFPIKGTKYYSEGTISSNRARFYAKQLLDEYKLSNEVKICISNK